MSAARLLIVGYGSIGQRHARLAVTLGCEVAIVSRRGAVAERPTYPDLQTALQRQAATHVIVANETAAHWPTLLTLRGLGFRGPVLVEKPLARDMGEITNRDEMHTGNVSIAYNLRFHPALTRLKKRTDGQKIISASFLAGQHLASWRPGRDLANTYSAQRAMGGGVLRDLSHEVDYLLWILGRWRRLAAIGGHLGPLSIDSDDCWSMVIATERCPSVVVQLDYYHRPGLRRITVNTADETIDVDLVRGEYSDASGKIRLIPERDDTYRLQLQHFLEETRPSPLCSFAEGVETMALISAAERASTSRVWVEA